MFFHLTPRVRAFIATRGLVKRRRVIEDDFPDFLRYMAACLRAGLSLRQALAEAAERMSGPIGEEISIAAGEVKAGVPVNDALYGLAERTGLPEAASVSAILKASIKYGGDSAAALDRLSAAAGQRGIMRREISALTAQSRFSALILSVLPVGFLIVFPAPARVLFSAKGIAVMSFGIVLNILGYLVLRRMSDPDRL